MPNNYAKLTPAGTLKHLNGMPCVSNPSDEMLEAYAAAHGFKPLRYTSAPPVYGTATWQETESEIVQVWQAPDMEQARRQAMEHVQQRRNGKMAAVTSLQTPFGWPLEYTQEAVSMAQGTLMLMMNGLCTETSWTDADNVRHEGLGMEDMKTIATLLAAHVRAIQDEADALRAQITAATTPEELQEILAQS